MKARRCKHPWSSWETLLALDSLQKRDGAVDGSRLQDRIDIGVGGEAGSGRKKQSVILQYFRVVIISHIHDTNIHFG